MKTDTPEAALAAKRALRARILAERDALPAPARDAASRTLIGIALAHPRLAAAHTLLAYASIGSEVRTHELLAARVQRGQRLVLPRVNRALRRLDLYAVRDLRRDLAPGTWDIPEPLPECCEAVARDDIDAVLVPGAAFTPRCERMGYGGGFYDRLLADWPGDACFIALAFDLQITEVLPLGAHDVPMHEVITPTRHFRCCS